MIDATISRVRLRDLDGLGRSRPARAGSAAAPSPSAARRRTGADAPARPAHAPEQTTSWHQPSSGAGRVDDSARFLRWTPHYENYPRLLIRLELARIDNIRNLIEDSWLIAAPARLAKTRAPDGS